MVLLCKTEVLQQEGPIAQNIQDTLLKQLKKLENFNLKKAKKAMAFSPNFPLGWPFGRHNHVTTKKWSLAGYSKAVI